MTTPKKKEEEKVSRKRYGCLRSNMKMQLHTDKAHWLMPVIPDAKAGRVHIELQASQGYRVRTRINTHA